ncbi:MAG TPA: hypothetical protein VGX21_23410 [Methylomirabilota bacterium]|nr:hypothetical protein [Methylomirabilota bacterium]
MAVRRLVPVLLLCVAIDFADPMLPGSVRFDPSESVEAAQARPSQSPDARPVPAGRPERLPPLERVQPPSPGAARLTTGFGPPSVPVRHRPRESDALTSASSIEDH